VICSKLDAFSLLQLRLVCKCTKAWVDEEYEKELCELIWKTAKPVKLNTYERQESFLAEVFDLPFCSFDIELDTEECLWMVNQLAVAWGSKLRRLSLKIMPMWRKGDYKWKAYHQWKLLKCLPAVEELYFDFFIAPESLEQNIVLSRNLLNLRSLNSSTMRGEPKGIFSILYLCPNLVEFGFRQPILRGFIFVTEEEVLANLIEAVDRRSEMEFPPIQQLNMSFLRQNSTMRKSAQWPVFLQCILKHSPNVEFHAVSCTLLFPLQNYPDLMGRFRDRVISVRSLDPIMLYVKLKNLQHIEDNCLLDERVGVTKWNDIRLSSRDLPQPDWPKLKSVIVPANYCPSFRVTICFALNDFVSLR
jgi:hypothetical protein